MKAIIFAGGTGTRMWPLSRKKSPKQFDKLIGDKSTLQLAIDRLTPDFSPEDIYISTNIAYDKIVREQLPQIPTDNFIFEPEKKDIGPAIALVVGILHKKFPHEPIAILWSDHLIKKNDLFKKILYQCEKIIKKHKDKIIFIGQKPRFASQNLGWIKFDKVSYETNNIKLYNFSGFHYRPTIEKADEYLENGNNCWNLGYFVTTTYNLWKLYEKYQPEMFTGLKELYKAYGTSRFIQLLKKIYPKMPKMSFDNAILEHINKEDAYVISEDLGWSDIGAWEALKEALQTSPEQNVINGKVLLTDCRDSLVYNYTDKLVVTIDINGLLVINTHDVVLVCHKNSVPKIKKLVEKLSESENQHLV